MFLSAVTGSQSQRTADDLLLDLGGAAVDGGDAAVEVGLGDRELHHVAVAAVELYALVDQLVLELGGVPLRHRRVDRLELTLEVLAEALVQERTGDAGLCGHLGDQEPVVLELPDRSAE